jgi:hypothetical protein
MHNLENQEAQYAHLIFHSFAVLVLRYVSAAKYCACHALPKGRLSWRHGYSRTSILPAQVLENRLSKSQAFASMPDEASLVRVAPFREMLPPATVACVDMTGTFQPPLDGSSRTRLPP